MTVAPLRLQRRVPRLQIGLPRQTVRLRLTVVYGTLFLLMGAALLAITYLLVARNLPAGPVTTGKPATGLAAPATLPAALPGRFAGGSLFVRAGGGGCHLLAGPSRSPAQLEARAQRCLSQQRALELNQLLTESGIALAIMTVVSVGLGWLVAGRMLGKLRTITAAARSISASNLNARLSLAGPRDELRELGDTFDGLLGRLEAAFDAQRQFVANASHELRTPLARQRTLIEVALADPEPTASGLRNLCTRLLATGEQQERLIEALLTLARSQRGLDRREPVDLAALTGEVMLARRPEAEERGLSVAATLDPALAVGDSRLAERLVANLIDNAVRHNVADGSVQVTTGIAEGCAMLSVTNTGPVISPDDVPRLVRPFQRRGADRIGTPDGLGLGLSIVAAIAEAHGGWLRLTARPAGGLAVRAGFPLAVRDPHHPRSGLADRGSGSRRQFDLDYQPATVARLGVDGALVGDGNSADDGQAQAGPSVVGAVGRQPAERLEDRRQRGGGDVLAGVAHGQPRLGGDGDLDPAVRLVVHDRVGDEIADEPLQQQRIACHQPLREHPAHADPVLGGQFEVGVQDRRGELVEAHRDLAGQAAFALGQHQQPFNEPFVTLVGAEQLAAEPVQVRPAVRVVHGYLGEQPMHGELGAQLVRGVGREPTLALVADHEPVQSRVDRVG